MWGVGAWQPVGGDTVAEPQGVETNLKGAEVEVSVGSSMRRGGGGLGEQGGGAASPSLQQHILGQLKHEVCRCLTWLVWHGWHDSSLAFVPVHQQKLCQELCLHTHTSIMRCTYTHCTNTPEKSPSWDVPSHLPVVFLHTYKSITAPICLTYRPESPPWVVHTFPKEVCQVLITMLIQCY